MIVFTIQAAYELDRSLDPLGRSYRGYLPGMSDLALLSVNCGVWSIGREAIEREENGLFVVAPEDNAARLAVRIDEFEPVDRHAPNSPEAGKYVIRGRILCPGDAVYDQYVGKPSPLGPRRNPVGYVREQLLCRCGCGKTSASVFIPGHDQTALHDRVKQVGNVTEFLDWFDAMRRPFDR